MAKLLFLLDGNVIKEYALDKERMTIGRRASNDVHIDNLAISGEHAEVITSGDEAFIQDLNSTNGTFVNKKQVKKQMLKHGDTIGLGKYQLKYLKDMVIVRQQPDGFADTVLMEVKSTVKKADVPSEAEKPIIEEAQTTSFIESESSAYQDQAVVSPNANVLPAASIAEIAPAPRAESEKQEPRLQILSGENAGNTLLLDKAMVKLGKHGEQVAVITKRQDGYFLTHVAGDHYPMVNGNLIGPQAYALHHHDEIEVLGVKMEFCLE
jgi:pSer/pThr/pTyr-binding forkhead associated (FHA) protein